MSKIYLGYIAYFIKNNGQDTSTEKWKSLLNNIMGQNPMKSSEKVMKNTALKLYFAHFLNLSMRINYKSLLNSDKTAENIRDIFVESEKFRSTHNLPGPQVVNYTDFKKAIEHMKKFQESENIIVRILESGNEQAKKKPDTKAKPIAKVPTKKPQTKKISNEVTKLALKSVTNTTSKKIVGEVTKPTSKKILSEVTKTAGGNELIPKKLKIPAMVEAKGKKLTVKENKEEILKIMLKNVTSKDYTIAELKTAAADREIAGWGKMKKSELAEALNIKVYIPKK